MRAALRDKRRTAAIERRRCENVLFRTPAESPESLAAASITVATLHVPIPGAVFRTSDGRLYATDARGSIHVARDEKGRRMTPPKAQGPRLRSVR